MQHEPSIDRTRLLRTVEAAYGVAATGLTFVPVGYATACYFVDLEGGEQRFLKLWPDTATARTVAARLPVTLPLMRALHDRAPEVHLPEPLTTRSGALLAHLDGQPFALFPVLPGTGYPDEPSEALVAALAGSTAAVHRATPLLADVLPPREAFDAPFEAAMRAAIDALGGGDGPRALRDLVLPVRAEILAQFELLHALGEASSRLDGPCVLCHTDIGGDNVLVDGPPDAPRLSLLDWDNATLSPPEADVRIAVEHHPARFIAAYREAGGAAPLHIDRFAFFLLRRALEDFAARLHRVLHESPPPEALPSEVEQDALDGMVRWGVDEWRALDGRLEVLRGVLARG